MALAAFLLLRPPASSQGQSNSIFLIKLQSKLKPLPPGKIDDLGGLASMSSWSETSENIETNFRSFASEMPIALMTGNWYFYLISFTLSGVS